MRWLPAPSDTTDQASVCQVGVRGALLLDSLNSLSRLKNVSDIDMCIFSQDIARPGRQLVD